jgi:ubiquinone/menaquinone biosynthesis C-methylase UbiE
MDPSSNSKSQPRGQYDANYGNFQTELYEQIRREAFGEDIGQNSWLTADELDRFLTRLELSPSKKLLDVACGAGGPILRMAAISGCSVVGIDVHEQAIATARSLASQRGLSTRAEFHIANAAERLPFADASFDAITCIDAINHLADRPTVIAEWARLLKPRGRLLFTDPITVTGPITNSEVSIRSSAGYYLWVPPGYDERVIAQSGLNLLYSQDVTQNMSDVAERRHAARASRASALRGIEGDEAFDSQQKFLEIAARIAKQCRLSRFLLVSEKPA